ncbi:MAG: CDP-alcohol phosphatidyltransferase family protein [Clostridia bacterium]|nr:CDP-alcohol phosphatidyltransferase family protein [Clostridia bacterium]
MANIVTGARIACSMLMLLFPVFSPEFCVLYLFCGISDMLDGAIARKTGSAGRFGEKLDTAADLVFTAVSLAKWLPAADIPGWLWLWIGGIAAIRLGNMIWGFHQEKRLISLHTGLNKAAGLLLFLLLFLLPLTVPFFGLKYTSVVVCIIATCASVQEGRRMRADYRLAQF